VARGAGIDMIWLWCQLGVLFDDDDAVILLLCRSRRRRFGYGATAVMVSCRSGGRQTHGHDKRRKKTSEKMRRAGAQNWEKVSLRNQYEFSDIDGQTVADGRT